MSWILLLVLRLLMVLVLLFLVLLLDFLLLMLLFSSQFRLILQYRHSTLGLMAEQDIAKMRLIYEFYP